MKKYFGFALLLCLTAVLLFSCGGDKAKEEETEKENN